MRASGGERGQRVVLPGGRRGVKKPRTRAARREGGSGRLACRCMERTLHGLRRGRAEHGAPEFSSYGGGGGRRPGMNATQGKIQTGGEEPEEGDGNPGRSREGCGGRESGRCARVVDAIRTRPSRCVRGQRPAPGGSAMGGLRRAARMCQGAAMARKTRVEGMRWNLGRSLSWRVSEEVEEDEAEREDQADEALGERD